MKNRFLGNILFFRQFLLSPAQTGSICPSSRFLAHAIASMALDCGIRPGLIVDLGAGSGVISQELLRRGVAPERILAIDISRHYLGIFSKICPEIQLHIGDARKLARILCQLSPRMPVQAVISSLPLRSLPINAVSEIMSEIWQILHERGGILIQYTYAMWLHCALEPYGFVHMERRYILLNLPPALVEAYAPGFIPCRS